MKKILASLAVVLFSIALPVQLYAQTDSGSVGLEGQIGAPPPSTPATISVPAAGAVFTEVPINVTGVCQTGLLVKLFKNGVFAGSATCENGSYTIQTDLFSGQNELVAIVFDDLDQEGPASNTVTVTLQSDDVSPLDKVTLTSNFARRGANPGDSLLWPLSIAGGNGPYAVSVNWGDGQESLTSVAFPGEFNIDHEYQNSGIYTIVVKATDNEGRVAYLQLVAVANGAVSTLAETDGVPTQTTIIERRFVWWPLLLLIPFIISTFWLGRRYELKRIRDKIEGGELPFNLS
ncbi:MAG: hypothetical protein AAF413_01140 [Patescibacteria group bacterium]